MKPSKEAIDRRELIKSLFQQFPKGMKAAEVTAVLWDEYKIDEDSAEVNRDLKVLEREGIVYQNKTDRLWYLKEGE